jgi:hypothetical protein
MAFYLFLYCPITFYITPSLPVLSFVQFIDLCFILSILITKFSQDGVETYFCFYVTSC